MKKVLVCILILAGFLRFIGIYPGYSQYHTDEPIIYQNAVNLVKNVNYQSLRFDYGLLPSLINTFFYKVVFIPFLWCKFYLQNAGDIFTGLIRFPLGKDVYERVLQMEIFGSQDLNALFWSRYVTALFSLGVVFLTYVLGKKVFSNKVGLIAALLVSFNFKSVQNGHIGLPDTYNVFFLLLSALFAFRLMTKSSGKNYILVGIFMGLSVSIKYQLFYLLPFFIAHIISVINEKKNRWKKLFNPYFFIALVLATVLFVLINPQFLFQWQKTSGLLIDIASKYGMGIKKINLYPLYYLIHADYGYILIVLIIAGILSGLRYAFKNSLILFSIVIPFWYIFFYYSGGGFYVRNLITITPFLMIFAGLTIETIYIFLRKRLNIVASFINVSVLLFFAIFLSARNSFINIYYYTKPWNVEQFREWQKENISKDAVIAVRNLDPEVALPYTNRKEFILTGNYSLNEHRESGVEYAIINLDWASYNFYYWMHFGIDRFLYLKEKPIEEMRNTFAGLAIEEMLRYSIHQETKPWQASDQAYFFIKPYYWTYDRFHLLTVFNFGKNEQNWEANGNSYGFDQSVGRKGVGSLTFYPMALNYSSQRMFSPLIPIKERYLYKISGFLKTKEILSPKNRNAFIRVDFYNEESNPPKVGLITSVSSRVYGTNDWVKKEIVERAPEGSKYVSISFQVNEEIVSKVWLDDISIFESEEMVQHPLKLWPYSIKSFDLDLLYPNSHGNL